MNIKKINERKCQNCALWDIQSATDKAGRIRKDWPARCLWASSEQWPTSVRDTHPRPGFSCAEWGTDCACFICRREGNKTTTVGVIIQCPKCWRECWLTSDYYVELVCKCGHVLANFVTPSALPFEEKHNAQ